MQPVTRYDRSAMNERLKSRWRDAEGPNIAEYAIMLAIVFAMVTGMVRMIGANTRIVSSHVGSAIH